MLSSGAAAADILPVVTKTMQKTERGHKRARRLPEAWRALVGERLDLQTGWGWRCGLGAVKAARCVLSMRSWMLRAGMDKQRDQDKERAGGKIEAPERWDEMQGHMVDVEQR